MTTISRLLALAMAMPFAFTSCSKQQQPAQQEAAAVTAGLSAARTINATNGNFNVLTYNVAGLPQILSSASTPRDSSTSQIGRLINNYDIVHVQEDFNYHAYLYDKGNAHPYRSTTSGGAGIGDGLNSLSYFPMTDFTRVTWNTRINENALTPKGFTYCRYRIAEGVYVDVYNMHTNAESDDASIAARADNLLQLSNFIAANSKGNAVIVMGDSNGRYTRDNNLRLLLNVNGMTDPWIELVRSGSIPALGSDAIVCDFPAITNNCEIVDKIYYRGSKFIQLSAADYNVVTSFVNAAGQQLSDHIPLTCNFNYTLSAAFRMSDLWGGPHGTPFNDMETLIGSSNATSFTIRGGSRVDQVQVTLANGTVLAHGGTGGTAQTLTLQSGETVNAVTICSGKYNNTTRIFYLKLTTSTGRTLAAGTQTTDVVTYTAPTGYKITGFFGNGGDEVDKLGVIYNLK
ncbi:jacalin-like lectin [Filimonas lacunae]|nr:jacalin-like lectin [Filimonas lacunae]BAV07832.1 exported protein [Filimonas lacunae]